MKSTQKHTNSKQNRNIRNQGGNSAQKFNNTPENVGSSQYKSPVMSPIKQLNLSRATCFNIDTSRLNDLSGQKDGNSSISKQQFWAQNIQNDRILN